MKPDVLSARGQVYGFCVGLRRGRAQLLIQAQRPAISSSNAKSLHCEPAEVPPTVADAHNLSSSGFVDGFSSRYLNVGYTHPPSEHRQSLPRPPFHRLNVIAACSHNIDLQSTILDSPNILTHPNLQPTSLCALTARQTLSDDHLHVTVRFRPLPSTQQPEPFSRYLPRSQRSRRLAVSAL
jgi:hypothetical protein